MGWTRRRLWRRWRNFGGKGYQLSPRSHFGPFRHPAGDCAGTAVRQPAIEVTGVSTYLRFDGMRRFLIFLFAIFFYFEPFHGEPKDITHWVVIEPKTCTAPIGVYFTGGLGNHLFGAAFGIARSLDRSGGLANLVFGHVPSNDLRYGQVVGLQNSLFSQLNIVFNFSDLILSSSAQAMPHFHSLLGYDDFCKFVEYTTPPCGDLELFEGYFQNINYFINYSSFLVSTFYVPAVMQSSLFTQYPALHSASVYAIHVRRGDYVEKAEFHNLLSIEYFAKALLTIQHTVIGAEVFVFSDDIHWAREQKIFNEIKNVHFVDESNTLISFYLLILASKSGLICSNSTFCWWAAFLSSTNHNRLVIFPERWSQKTTLTSILNDQDCGSGLYLPFMTLLGGF